MQRCCAFLLFALCCLQGAAFCHTDEESIRQILKTMTGRPSSVVHMSAIKEGLTNRNFKVLVDGTVLFVRLGHADPQSLRIDRRKEFCVYNLVEKAWIAPKLLYADPSTGSLVTTFIQGTPYGKRGGVWLYDRAESIRHIVALLKCAHAYSSPDAQGDEYPFKIVDAYIQQARTSAVPLPEDIDRAIDIIQSLKRQIPAHARVLCHQDLVPENFLFDGQRLYLVDWEYAEWSNPFYDLASLCVEHGYDEEEKQMLLEAYFQTPSKEQRRHLEMMCMLYSMRDALWYFLEQERLPEQKDSFLELARHHYQNFFASERWLRGEKVVTPKERGLLP